MKSCIYMYTSGKSGLKEVYTSGKPGWKVVYNSGKPGWKVVYMYTLVVS